ncbi:MAG: hypothetical protein K0S33_4078, partial [Bacteroidetes bacterium]|nr:hypothetical protein [Bacteroidota bacterium]
MKLNLLRVFILPFFVLISGLAMSQSNNCSTATNINLSSGSACVNGTTVGAITDNILYGTCNTVSVNMVWYTYVTNGSNNTFTVTPGTMTNPEIVLYTGSCPQAGSLQTCNTASGSTALNTTWGLTAGTQVWVGIASNNGTQGTFQLCINSTPPAPGPGNTCAQAIPLCSNATFSKPTMTNNSSGQQAGCFLDPPQRDVWLKFTVTTSGTLAWTATPTVSTTEFDWVLWDVTSGCPGTVVCCNYHYGNNAIGTNPIGSSNGFGMQAITGNGACGIQAVNTNANREYCPPAAVTCGRTYAIQISNYNNTNAGFSLAFTNSTCTIGGNASFTVSPPLICGASTTATITDASTGDCAAVWTYGDGTSYTGPTPPAHTYTTPGTYAITEVIGGACPSNHTEYVQLYGPLSATATATNESCAGSCNGTASVTAVTGGNGVYTYAWSNGATTGSISGLCAGTYTVTISNAICSTSITRTVTITGPAGATVSVNSPTTCAGVGVALNASGATTYSWTPSTGLSATTGSTVTANPPGTTTYTVTGTTSGCTSTATSTVTITPAVTVSVNSPSTCAGVGVALNASGATTYSWTPSTGLSATTGATVTANPPATTTYTVTGTTSGCTGTATSTVTINAALTVTVNSATVCAGTSTALTAGGATTYSWTPSTGLSATTGTTVTANPASTTIYTVTGTTSGCNGTGTSTVTVNPLPVVAVNSPTICAGASGTLTATGATTYSWTPSTGLSATTGASVTANPALTTTYTVTGTASGCDGTASSTVTVNPLPIVTVNSATVCAG